MKYDEAIKRTYNYLQGVKSDKKVLDYLELLTLSELADLNAETIEINGGQWTYIDKRLYGAIDIKIRERLEEMSKDIFGIKDMWRQLKRKIKSKDYF